MAKDLDALKQEFNTAITKRILVILKVPFQEGGRETEDARIKNAILNFEKKVVTSSNKPLFNRLVAKRKKDLNVETLADIETLKILLKVKSVKGNLVVDKLIEIQSNLSTFKTTASKDYQAYLDKITPIVNTGLGWLDPSKSQNKKADSKTWNVIQTHLEEVTDALNETKKAEELIKKQKEAAEKKAQEEKAALKKAAEEKTSKQIEENDISQGNACPQKVFIEAANIGLETMKETGQGASTLKQEKNHSDNQQQKENDTEVTDKQVEIYVQLTKYAEQLRKGDWFSSWLLIPVFGFKRTRLYKAEQLESLAKEVLDAANKTTYLEIITTKRNDDHRLTKSCFWHREARTRNLLDNIIAGEPQNYISRPGKK